MSFFKQTIRDVPLDDQAVLVRAEFDVPLASDGTIADDFRIRSSLPTLQELIKRGCTAVIISHLGRPDGRDLSMSLEQVALRLGELLDHDVIFVDDCIGDTVKQAVKKAPKGSIILLENLRFHAEEKADDASFAQHIAKASQARYFVQDAFGNAHRKHASMDAMTQYLPSVAGLLLEKEYTTIVNAMRSPQRPLVAVMGGAKVSDKIKAITELIEVADTIVISGAMANTFLSYRGMAMGKSKVEPDQQEILDDIYMAATKKVGESNVDDFLVLPIDVAVATAYENAPRREVAVAQLANNDMALDVGQQTMDEVDTIVRGAKTVIWNGPLGVAEFSHFAHGSARLALMLATHPEITSIIGGGDTAEFVLGWDARKGASFTHVSTGGGASLELMAGEKLPGVESLLDARN